MRTPSWYWPWVRWILGEGEFKGDPRNPARRPAGIPRRIPSWAWLRLKLFLLARNRKLQNVPPPPVSHEDELAFWRRMSFWVTRIDHFPPSYASAYSQNQYPIAIVPTLFGTGPGDTVDGLLQYTREMQSRGFKVCGSGWGKGGTIAQAEAEADAAAIAVDRFGFDGWVMNGEKAYEGGGLSGAWVRRFRKQRPHLPLGWSPEVRLSLDHDVLQANGVCYMPQVYPLEIPRATMPYAVEWAKNFGYDLKNVVPLVQAYTTNDVRANPHTFRDQARFLGLPGLCLYPANQCVDAPEFWRALAF